MEFSGLNCREEDKLVANDCNGNVSRKSKSSMGSEDDAGLGSEKQGFQTGFYPVSPQDQSPKGAGTSPILSFSTCESAVEPVCSLNSCLLKACSWHARRRSRDFSRALIC